jgi:hypothetical protein
VTRALDGNGFDVTYTLHAGTSNEGADPGTSTAGSEINGADQRHKHERTHTGPPEVPHISDL